VKVGQGRVVERAPGAESRGWTRIEVLRPTEGEEIRKHKKR
jgi:hypothetical protein